MDSITKAARAIKSCSAIVIATGAGMGVDSGLPDFRGDDGFWKAYPPFKKLGLSFTDLADPRWFKDNPQQAWGFYGHRMQLYRSTQPHNGYQILKSWAKDKLHGCFSFTSNVDCHFQSAGFESNKVVECHGSFSHLQCRELCTKRTWTSSNIDVAIDESTMMAEAPLPRCPECDTIARPNILMFGDCSWIGKRSGEQTDRFNSWLSTIPRGEIAIIEIGAGTAIPSVRRLSERLVTQKYATLIRINPRESKGPAGTISISQGGLQTLEAINDLI